MVLSQDEYAVVRDRISVAEAREPVKIAYDGPDAYPENLPNG
jgi:hypothetical protein